MTFSKIKAYSIHRKLITEFGPKVFGDRRSDHRRLSFPKLLFKGTRRSRAASMFERSELRSRREERMENSVKNLMGNESIPQNLFI